MTAQALKKAAVVLTLSGGLFAFWFWGGFQLLTLESLKAHQVTLQSQIEAQYELSLIIFFLIYVTSTALSFPGAALLTLGAGALYGLSVGTLLTSLASTTGATLALLISRFLLRDWVQGHFRGRLKRILDGFEKDGLQFLFLLRLLPLFPFFLVNLVMGLTKVRVLPYFGVSLLGMLPGTLVYVNAGTQLAKIESLSGLLSVPVLASFALIGAFPLLMKALLQFFQTRRFLRRFRRPSKFDYNSIVIGGGSAGLVSAYLSAAAKAKVALIEKHKMGGDCLHTGCIPSKTLLRSAKAIKDIRQASSFGIATSAPEVDFAAVMKRVHEVIKSIEPHDSPERYQALGVDCLQGEAKILSPFEVQVGDRVFTARNLIVATGASPLIPPIPGLSSTNFRTSESLWDMRVLPSRMVILGGGAIGCEMAQAFSLLGSRVTLIEKADRLLGKEDLEASRAVHDALESCGVEIKLGHEVTAVDGTSKQLHLKSNTGVHSVSYDELLLALGRKANVQGFGLLENLEAELNSNGTLATTPELRLTRYPNIYACGDVAGPYQFTHMAASQASIASMNALFSPLSPLKRGSEVVPWCTFTFPQVARVGLVEFEARDQQIPYEQTYFPLGEADRSRTDGEKGGFIKILTRPGSDQILGVTIVHSQAGEMIAEFVLAMRKGLGLNQILSTIHLYPSFTEANKLAAGAWRKKNLSERLLSWSEKFHHWRRG